MSQKLEQSLLDLCRQHDLTALSVSVHTLTDRHFFSAVAHTAGQCFIANGDNLPTAVGSAIEGVKAKAFRSDPVPLPDEELEAA